MAQAVFQLKRPIHRPTMVVNKGYILLFTLGVLVVISVLILSMAASLRLDAQLIGRGKTRLQSEYTLKGAVQYAAARLNVTQATLSQLAGKPPDPVSRRKLWFASEGPYPLEFSGSQLTVQIEDAGVLPDANLLSEPEWERLFVELGAGEARASGVFAKAIYESKLRIAKGLGSLGFASLQELVNSQSLPRHLTAGVNSQGRFGIHDVLVVGSESKQLDVNRSPLVLFKVLAGFNDSQLGNLQLARTRGEIAPIEGQKILSGSSAKMMTGKTDMLTVKIYFNNGNDSLSGLMVVALLKLENNTYKVIDQFIAEKY